MKYAKTIKENRDLLLAASGTAIPEKKKELRKLGLTYEEETEFLHFCRNLSAALWREALV